MLSTKSSTKDTIDESIIKNYLINNLNIKGIGGLTLGADPIAYAAAYTSYLRGKPVEAFVVRKTAKPHGTMQWIEGNITKGEKLLLLMMSLQQGNPPSRRLRDQKKRNSI